MDNPRRILVKAIKTKDNELIPIWDERIVFEKTEMFGNVITLKDDMLDKHYYMIDCIYDLKTRELKPGIELDIYPNEDSLEFKKGDDVLFEESNRLLKDAKIVDIVYEEYDLTIKKGKKIEKYYSNLIDCEIDKDSLYAIKHWKPFYVLDSGEKVENTYKLYRKSK